MVESAETTTKPARKPRRTAKSIVEKKEAVVETAASALSLFDNLLKNIFNTKNEFENLQREVAAIKESWKREQGEHQRQTIERDTQEEIERKRERERYEYETQVIQKKAENDFGEKLGKWEKELAERKEDIEQNQKELESLREQVANFENEKGEAVGATEQVLEKELTEKFETAQKLREQEIKAEKEILNLKLESLTAENNKQSVEINALKKALNEATAQVKQIAVKVIEAGSGSSSFKPPLE